MRKPMRTILTAVFVVALGLSVQVVLQSEGAAAKAGVTPRVTRTGGVDTSSALRDLVPIPPKSKPLREIPFGALPKSKTDADSLSVSAIQDPVLQESFAGTSIPDPINSFDGVGNLDGVLPPDTNGDVGPNHYVQWVNLHFQIFDKNGTSLYGPAAGNTLWQNAVGQDACKNFNDGDPIVLYDQQADRWVMTQFALPNYPDAPFYECIAVSATGDPTGSYYLYQFQFDVMNDYPKLGIWPDGYYMTVNQFASGSGIWAGAGVVAFERDKMLAGDPSAQMVYFDLKTVNSNFGGLLPADWDGILPPPVGSPNYVVEVDDSSYLPPSDALRLWKFHVDWTTPANSTLGLSGQPNSVLPVADFTPICPSTRNCISQPNTVQKLDAIGDRLMYRLQYRNFGDHEALVTNHTVDAGSGKAGIRWYEIRDPGGTPVIHQQGTYAPDAENRWMGSIAMDGNGNMALGYSVSSSTIYPSIRYTGRLATDPAGEMSRGEGEMVTGGGSQTSSHARWGDYSMMSVDPSDDCTFWYTQEYVQTTGAASWKTRIGSFKFPSCSAGATGTLQGTVTDLDTGNPIGDATVTAGQYTLHTNVDGQFTVVVPIGSYAMNASAVGYGAASANGITVNVDQATTQDFALSPLPRVRVCGTVSDGSGHGWGLYARIDISGSGYADGPIFTDPATGQYCVDLFQGRTYTFNVTAVNGGYSAKVVTGPSNEQLDFQLLVDTSACRAPGYTQTTALATAFDSASPPTLPGGWAVLSVTGTSGNWATSTGTHEPSGHPAHSTPNLVYFNSYDANVGDSSRLYLASGLDLTGAPMASLTFWMYHDTGYSYDDRIQVQVSTDGGSIWANVGSAVSRFNGSTGWKQHSVDLGSYTGAGMNDVRVGLLGISDFGNDVHIDDIQIVTSCTAQSGGLVVGHVYDANTLEPKNGATVDAASGHSAKTAATDNDPATRDGLYTLFLPPAQYELTATYAGYGNAAQNVIVSDHTVTGADFSLPSGLIASDPANMSMEVFLGQSQSATLTLSNAGTREASFELVELSAPPALPTGPYQRPNLVVKPFKQGFVDAQSLSLPSLPGGVPTISGAGEVLQTWSTNLDKAWGIAYDDITGTVWVSSPGESWGGTDTMYEYSANGAPTGNTLSFSWPHTNGPADATRNWNTGMMWIMNVFTGTANCIYEVDPTQGPTGRQICPGGGTGFPTSQRGLAYDPTNDTYYAGSYNDSMVHHFDANGVILDEVDVGLPISGLAYNPNTRHLFAMVNASSSPIYVLDAANKYEILGQFSIPGFTAGYGGAGLEIDCSGNLWAVDQKAQTVFQISSGETTNLCVRDVPWLSTVPAVENLAIGSARSVTVTFDAAAPGIAPGQYRAQLMVKGNTAYPPGKIPVTMNVVAQHTIKARASANGSISPAGAVTLLDGNDQSFTFKADRGYVLKHVLVDGVSVGKPSTYTFRNVTRSHIIRAVFTKGWKIRTLTGTGGSISPTGTVWVENHKSRVFRIKPEPGFQVKQVYVDGRPVGAVNRYTFRRIVRNHTIKAVFAP
jgi:hypothetical protein